MTTSAAISPPRLNYSPTAIARAERSIRCAPFRLELYATMRQRSVPLLEIAGRGGCDRHFTHRPLAEAIAENQLMWLIQVGVLRREVDGQGITDSFRLTPLGHQLVEQWQASGSQHIEPATCYDRLKHWQERWLRSPF